MFTSDNNNNSNCYENPQLLITTGTRVGDSYVAAALSNASSAAACSTYQHIQSQNVYLPYECNMQAECRNLGFGPDYGHHFGF